MKKKHLLVVFALVAGILQAQTIIYVKNGIPTGGQGTSWQYPCTLEEALSRATPGSQIWVYKGLYYPESMLIVPDSVQLYGSFSEDENDPSERDFSGNTLSTIDAQKQFGPVVYLSSGAELNGFAIQNGFANDNPHRDGGGVWANSDARVTNCFIVGNTALANGGGLYARGDVTVTYCSVFGNAAGNSGDNLFGNCLTLLAGQGWLLDMLPPSDPFSFLTHPSTTPQTRDQGEEFPELSVSVHGNEPFEYQWYVNSKVSTTGGTPIEDATQPTYTPPSAIVGVTYYYCVVNNPDGRMTSYLSGAHTVQMPPAASGCNTNTPGWGGSLGTAKFVTDIVYTIYADGVTQIWSDAVTTSVCEGRTTYAGGSSNNYNADCRSNPNYPGDLFSWCAVVRYRNDLCPAPWRVPSSDDFRILGLLLGSADESVNNYIKNSTAGPKFQALSGEDGQFWGGTLNGRCNRGGSVGETGTYGRYWSLTEYNGTNGLVLRYNASGNRTYPRYNYGKEYGVSVRCVQ